MTAHTKHLRITVEGKPYDVTVEVLDDAVGRAVTLSPPATRSASLQRAAAPVVAMPSPKATAGAVVSPLAGVVISVDVVAGQRVSPGDVVVTLEAMKMKTPVRAAAGGTVQSIGVAPGTAVEEGATLLVMA